MKTKLDVECFDCRWTFPWDGKHLSTRRCPKCGSRALTLVG